MLSAQNRQRALSAAMMSLALTSLSCDRSTAPAPDNSLEEPSQASAAPASSPSVAPAPLSPPKPEAKRPYNVVLIYVDSLRADMPWSGYPRKIAPNLTKFAQRAVWYENAYSLSSYTAKSIPPSLIGGYPSELKRDGYFFTKWSPENPFLAERVQGAGHRTLAGHVHGYFQPKLAMGPAEGVDDYRMIEGHIDLQAVKSVT
ncbi:MAG: sulfatase-like hydrolase/transferase, partial [Myxococcales bacterium]|nr:sulfatase-like hydrolase/transferase [Myxococcales bacterium]